MESISLHDIRVGNLYTRQWGELSIFGYEDPEYDSGWLSYDPDEKNITQCRLEVSFDGIVVKHFNPFFDKDIVYSFDADNSCGTMHATLVQFLANLFPLHSLSQEAIEWWKAKDAEAKATSDTLGTLRTQFEDSIIKKMSAEICEEIDNEIINSIMKGVGGFIPK